MDFLKKNVFEREEVVHVIIIRYLVCENNNNNNLIKLHVQIHGFFGEKHV